MVAVSSALDAFLLGYRWPTNDIFQQSETIIPGRRVSYQEPFLWYEAWWVTSEKLENTDPTEQSVSSSTKVALQTSPSSS
jgi:hypothetical protein